MNQPVDAGRAAVPHSWAQLRRHTAARIALGRSGSSLLTQDVLALGLAHAQARDAVQIPLYVEALCAQLEVEGWPLLQVASQAPDRAAYLARPDWGRCLHADSATLLDSHAEKDFDLVIVISDGLSSTAVQSGVVVLLVSLMPLLTGLRLAPLVIATQARVALSDEVGARLRASAALSLIGERPGLSSPDSLGAYLTYGPRIGNTDEARNCISNIRPAGLTAVEAAPQLAALIRGSLQAQSSGVALRFVAAPALASDQKS